MSLDQIRYKNESDFQRSNIHSSIRSADKPTAFRGINNEKKS